MRIIITEDYNKLSTLAANEIVKLINEKSNCILGLATGSTPLGTYKNLIELYNNGKVDFNNVVSFNLDEYLGLDSTHPQSYRYFMDNNLFNHINIKKENTHIPNGVATDIKKECLNYDKAINDIGNIDLQILGIGTNGHIGFNEPSSYLVSETHVTDLKENTINANSRFFNSLDEVPTSAITMGLYSIMHAKKIILLANGENKSDIISRLAEGKITTDVPASILLLHKNVTVILDKLAASKIKFINQNLQIDYI